MNGRVYDPNLGRFLSVDPVFEFPTNTQSLNPYSYVLNNPLSMTDPTGYAASDASGDCGPVGSKCPSTSDKLNVMTGSHIHGVKTGIKGSDVKFLQGQQAAKAAFWMGVLGGNNPLGNGNTKTQGAGDIFRGGGEAATTQTTTTKVATLNNETGSETNDWSGPPSSTKQTLTDDTIGRGKSSHYKGEYYWSIHWKLEHPSKKGGWIIQHIRSNIGKGRKYDYWEAWQVRANYEVTTLFATNPAGADDTFIAPVGSDVLGTARFYEGLTLPSFFTTVHTQGDAPAGVLRATTVNPHLPTANATPPVTRWWFSGQ